MYVCSACLQPGEADGIGPLDTAFPAARAAPTRDCPACGGAVPIAAIRCAHCEWDLSAVGAKPKAGPKRCPSCGFDRAGWGGRRCPKCKKKVEHEDITERMTEASAAGVRREWSIIAGSLFVGVVSAAIIAELAGVPALFLGAGLVYLVSLPFAWLGLLVAAAMWVPIEVQIGLSIGKIASVYALHLPVMIGMLLLAAYIPFLPMLGIFGAYLGLLMWAFDLDWADAAWLTLIIGVVTLLMFAVLQRVF